MKIKNYFTPKSLVYTGKHDEVKTTIRHYHYNENNLKMTNNFKPMDGYKSYIQVIGLSDIEKIKSLKDDYSVNILTLEDIFNVEQRNKIEHKEQYIFSVFGVDYLKDEALHHDYMSVLLFSDALITFHEKEPQFLDAIHPLFTEEGSLKKESVDYLYFHIIDIITDHHLDVYDYLKDAAVTFESDILESKKLNQESVYTLRKNLLRLKNNVSPILEQFNKLTDKNSPLIHPENLPLFEDVRDHLKRLDERLNDLREMMRYLLDLYINNQSNTMNRIMTTLTLFSAIFIPLSFLTGFFGMNFTHFAILDYQNALLIFVSLCVILAVLMIMLFKKMKWF
ncbi:MAG: CorA family divalent cation transporter [Bacillota bacterium]